METQDLGFRTAGIVGLQVDDRTRAALLSALRQMPLVRSVAAATQPPADGAFSTVAVTPLGAALVEPMRYNLVSPEYFGDLGMIVVSGRGFTSQDAAGALPVAILSEAAAHRLFPGQGIIGQEVRLTGDDLGLKSRASCPFVPRVSSGSRPTRFPVASASAGQAP